MYDPDESYRGLSLARAINGNLLVFNDAMRRTDSFARQGGLGDTIEVDLLQTRQVMFKSQETVFSQIGPNPIFHRSPVKDGALPPDFAKRTLKVSAPHGLTYDLVRNAKVAQTAILVQPALYDTSQDDGVSIEGAPSEWQLAQVRVRRMILPETQLNAALTRRQLSGTKFEFDLRWRREGLERIPGDFAVDLARADPVALVINVDGVEYKLKLPEYAPVDESLRLMVSFHKGRWDPQQPSDPVKVMPYWAPQIYAQRRQRDSMGWVTIGRSTCHGREPWLAGDGKITLVVTDASSPAAYGVQMSDYTDARWLLFMGAIPGTGRQPPEEYILTPYQKDGKLRLTLSRGTFGDLAGPPQDAMHWTDDRTEFFVLFVSTPPSNIMAGRFDPRDRALLAFKPVNGDQAGSQPEFELLGDSPALNTLPGSTAVLCSFHRISSPSQKESNMVIDSLETLIGAIFPDEVNGHPRESLIRPTGSHWGPMRIA